MNVCRVFIARSVPSRDRLGIHVLLISCLHLGFPCGMGINTTEKLHYENLLSKAR